jgi:hypothetical protein
MVMRKQSRRANLDTQSNHAVLSQAENRKRGSRKQRLAATLGSSANSFGSNAMKEMIGTQRSGGQSKGWPPLTMRANRWFLRVRSPYRRPTPTNPKARQPHAANRWQSRSTPVLRRARYTASNHCAFYQWSIRVPILYCLEHRRPYLDPITPRVKMRKLHHSQRYD